MAVYLLQETEPFEEIAEGMRQRGFSNDTQVEVRRPVRGLQNSKDVFAHIKVIDSHSNLIPFVNAGALFNEVDGIGYSNSFSNFLLQRVSISRAELRQFVKTFGLTYLFMFGENPIMVNVEGGLVHSADFRWDEEWWVNYENTLRGTRLAQMGARAYLCYEGVLIEGYILTASTNRAAMAKNLVPLAFQMAATNIKFLARVGSTDFPISRYQVDLTRSSSLGNSGINDRLPTNRGLQYRRDNVGTILSDRTDGNSWAQFGSFNDMFRAIVRFPGSAAGTSFPGAFGAVDTAGARRDPKFNRPPPVYGKIRLNYDEYIGARGMQGSNPNFPADQMQHYMRDVDEVFDQPIGGDVARQVMDNDDVNVATTEGLGEASHGVGQLDQDTDGWNQPDSAFDNPVSTNPARLSNSHPFATAPALPGL